MIMPVSPCQRMAFVVTARNRVAETGFSLEEASHALHEAHVSLASSKRQLQVQAEVQVLRRRGEIQYTVRVKHGLESRTIRVLTYIV
jgi:hypothetical protein